MYANDTSLTVENSDILEQQMNHIIYMKYMHS